MPIHNDSARSFAFVSGVIDVKATPTKQVSIYSRFLKWDSYSYRQSISDCNLLHVVAKCVYVHGHTITSRFIRSCTAVRGLVKQTSRWGGTNQFRQAARSDSDGELLLNVPSRVWNCLMEAEEVLFAPKIHMQQNGLWISFSRSGIKLEPILSFSKPLVVDSSARGPPRRM